MSSHYFRGFERKKTERKLRRKKKINCICLLWYNLIEVRLFFFLLCSCSVTSITHMTYFHSHLQSHNICNRRRRNMTEFVFTLVFLPLLSTVFSLSHLISIAFTFARQLSYSIEIASKQLSKRFIVFIFYQPFSLLSRFLSVLLLFFILSRRYHGHTDELQSVRISFGLYPL